MLPYSMLIAANFQAGQNMEDYGQNPENHRLHYTSDVLHLSGPYYSNIHIRRVGQRSLSEFIQQLLHEPNNAIVLIFCF